MITIEQFLEAKAAAETLEAQLEDARMARSEIARLLYEQDGKGTPYEVDGKLVVVSRSKGNTYFMTPKRKPRKAKKAAAETPAAETETQPTGRVIEASATLKPAGRMGEAVVENGVQVPAENSDPLAAALNSVKEV